MALTGERMVNLGPEEVFDWEGGKRDESLKVIEITIENML